MDFRAHSGVGEEFEQGGMSDATIDDVDHSYSTRESIEATFDLRDHATVDDTVFEQRSSIPDREGGDEVALGILDPLDVGEQEKLLCAMNRSQVALFATASIISIKFYKFLA